MATLEWTVDLLSFFGDEKKSRSAFITTYLDIEDELSLRAAGCIDAPYWLDARYVRQRGE